MASSRATTFDPSRHVRLSDQVSLRDEEFGALAYHHGSRRLVFVTSRGLLDVIRRLDDFGCVNDALAATVDPAQHRNYHAALATLWESDLLCE